MLFKVRHLSGQATIPKTASPSVGTFSQIDHLPKYSPPPQPAEVGIRKYLVATAITEQQIAAALALGTDFVPPTHEVTFLDAIAAHHAEDYRSAVLYAAASVEIAFGAVIDREYERLVSAHDDDRFRIIALPQPAGSRIYKDPIYERLRRRPDFSILINELALYVLHRSLLVEDESLYQQAKRLYVTRNLIVHTGELGETGSSKPYSLNHSGSMEALRVGVALFAWLGGRADFALPDFTFMRYSRAEKE